MGNTIQINKVICIACGKKIITHSTNELVICFFRIQCTLISHIEPIKPKENYIDKMTGQAFYENHMDGQKV